MRVDKTPLSILAVNKYHRLKGGAETIFFAEMEQLRERGHSVVPFSMKDDANLSTPFEPYFVDAVDYEKSGLADKIIASSKILYSWEARSKISSLLDGTSFDVAHLHNIYHQISPSILAPLRQRKIPIVLTVHDLKLVCGNYKMYINGHVCERCKGGKHFHLLLNRCTKGSLAGSLVNTVEMYLHDLLGFYRQVDVFIAVSHFYRDKLIEFGVEPDKIVVLPSFVDTRQYEVAESVGDYALYFGRLSEEKGVDTFIDAAQHNPHIPHWIVGTGPEEELLKARMSSLGLANVTFLGFQTGAALKKLVREALTIVVPSRWYENSPLTVLEAYASGRPVVGADIGGIPELVGDDESGLLFRSGNAQDLADQIAFLAADPARATAMGLRGRERIQTHFSEEVHIARLLEIYRQAKASF